jgi:hypothetical protein
MATPKSVKQTASEVGITPARARTVAMEQQVPKKKR